jgi:hypothetical protein
LDGLATVYNCVIKESGNPFLDTPSPYWCFDYGSYGFCWCAECVNALAMQYALVKDEIAAMERYVEWFERNEITGDPTRQVIETLIALEDNPYEEDDDGASTE